MVLYDYLGKTTLCICFGPLAWKLYLGCEVKLVAVKTQEITELHYSRINYEIESNKLKESIENILPRIIMAHSASVLLS
jgi:hypothetical protein